MHWFKNLIEKLSLNFKFNKKNSPSLKIVNKAKVANMQVGQVNIQGLTYSEAKDLIVSVVDQKFIALKDEAEKVYKERLNEFIRFLLGKIVELPEEEIIKLKEPDTQLALIEAAKISGRKQNTELRNLLANLVIGRIKNERSGNEELKNIVYNEAISTVNKLTVDQLKIITLCYLLQYTRNTSIISWESFNNYLENFIKPFLEFKNTNAEFQHIEYSGCGSIGILHKNLVDILKSAYSILFLKLVSKQEIEALIIPENIKKDIFFLDEKEQKYLLTPQNEDDLRTYLKEKSNDELLNRQIFEIYASNIMDNDKIVEKINNNSNIGKVIINLWNRTGLSTLSLTSVGIVIAVAYFEQVTGEKIDIDIWIN